MANTSSLLSWFSRHCPLPPSSLPSFLQPPAPPSNPTSTTENNASDKDRLQGVGSRDGDGNGEEIHGADPPEEVGGGFQLTTARVFKEVLRNLPAVSWLSLPSSSLPPFSLQAAIPASMATPSPSPSLHLSDVDVELPGEPQDPVHAEPAAHMGMTKVKLPGRRRLCKLISTSSDQDHLQDVEMEEPTSAGDFDDEDEDAEEVLEYHGTAAAAVEELQDLEMETTVGSGKLPYNLQDVGSSSWEVKKPTSPGDCEDEDNDVEEVVEYQDTDAATVEKHDKLANFEMEATVSSWEMEEPTSTWDCEDENDDVEEVVDTDTVEEQDELSDLEMGETAGSGKPQDVGGRSYAAAPEEQDELPDFEMGATVGSGKPPYKLPARILNKLYAHQREGLSWLWSLHCRETGGILGDEMGLGKTMQVSAFLAGLFHSGLIRRVLIITPTTILTNWIKELSVVGLRHKISNYSGRNKDDELQHAFKEGGILLTTYDKVRINYEQIRGDFYHDEEEGKMWNYVILDEAHFIKNPTAQRSRHLLEIPCVHRIAISGTLIQNNLKEMWSIFSFCCPEVLGDMDEFRRRYELPINQGNDKSASNQMKHIGSNVAKELRERIKPYFLRRKKSEVSLETALTDDKQLPKKNELIIWLKLTDCQRQLYKASLKCELVHLAASRRNPLAAINVLKKICDHPQTLTKRDAEHILEGIVGILNNHEMEMAEKNEMEMAAKMAMNLRDMARDDDTVEDGPEVSCKLSFILALLRNLLEEGHHVLIFSQTHKMLDMIQEAILLEGYNFLRMDANTKISKRERIVKDFQEGLGAQIFLLTTKVGGLGLTLTKAARVIVVDPDWNPSTDNQSVDRVYRIGQTKNVIAYRLMTSATVEEKIYKMQVLKGALFRAATEKNGHKPYFSQSEIQDPFSLPEQGFNVSLTQKQLLEEHGHPPDMDESLREHIELLEQQPGVAGVTYHSLLFSETAVLPMLNENNALGRGAHAKPKDECFTATTCTNSEIPEDEDINRLTEFLASTTLEPRLPECADEMVNALDNKKLTADSSPSSFLSLSLEVIS